MITVDTVADIQALQGSYSHRIFQSVLLFFLVETLHQILGQLFAVQIL
jgi:hypothetical protein